MDDKTENILLQYAKTVENSNQRSFYIQIFLIFCIPITLLVVLSVMYLSPYKSQRQTEQILREGNGQKESIQITK